MNCFSALAIAAAIVVGPAFGSQIQIGGVNGLTSSYITGGCSTNVGGQTCIAGSAGGFVEQNYDAGLFTGATNSGTSPSPYTGYSSTAASAGTITDSSNPGGHGNVTFSMINDGLSSGASNNFWDATSASTIKVPVGVYDVTEVGTLLNNIWGSGGATDTQVTFDFGNSNAHTVTSSLVLTLTNAGTTGPASGQIGTAVDCTSQTTTPTQPCFGFAIGPLASSSTVNGVTVDTSNVFASAYNTVAAGQFMSSAGTLNMEDQVFLFGSSYLNQYLVDIQVTELSGASGISQTALSGITVLSSGTSPTPEPSTLLLAMVCLGGLGLGRRMGRKS